MADEPKKPKKPEKDLYDALLPRGDNARTLRDILGQPPDRPKRKVVRIRDPDDPALSDEELAKARERLAQRFVERKLRAEQEQQAEQEFVNRAIAWLENKWGEVPCPYCQYVEWQVGSPLELSVSGDEAMSPTFPVMCGNCGHTTFINAIRAGLFPEPEEE